MAGTKFFYADVADAQDISRGNLCALDGGTIVTAADETWDTNEATTRANFVSKFAGVATRAHANGDGDKHNVPFAAEGVFDFTAVSDDYEIGDLVGPAKDTGNALLANKVKAVSTLDEAIGTVVKKAGSATTVKVRVFERLSKLNWPVAAIIAKDGSVAFTANQSMGTNRLTSLGAPTTAADAARVDDVTAPGSAALSIGAEDGSDNIALTIQLKDAKNANLATKREIMLWMSAADGGAEAAITDMTVTTGVLIKEETANACMRIVTDATGKAVVTLQKTGGVAQYYACVRHPGNLVTTLVVNWA